MELALFIYLANILPNIQGFLIFVTVSLLFLSFIHSIFSEKFNKLYSVLALVTGFISTSIPSERAMWLMAGGYAAQSVYQSEIGEDIKSIVKLKIKQQFKELAELKNAK